MPSEATRQGEGRLAGKHVIVTGAGQGIGRSIAIAIGQEGGHVICVDVNEETVQRTTQELDGDSTFHVADVSSESEVGEIFSRLRHTRISGLCNVAGIAGPQSAAHSIATDEWDQTTNVNLRGTFLMTRGVLPFLLESAGAIVNIASALAHIGWRKEAAYGPTKAAVVQFTKSLALDYAPIVRANSISPGAVKTPMIEQVLTDTDGNETEYGSIHPLTGRLIPPSAIANACVFLLSEDAAFITGIDLPVDAGMLAIGRRTGDLL